MSREEVLILGDYRYTPTYCQSIAKAGYRPLVADAGRCTFSAAARATAETFDLQLNDPDELGDWLVGFATDHPGLAAVMPVGDRTAKILARVQDKLPSEVAAIVGSSRSIADCVDKATMSRIVDEIGAPQAEYRVAASLGQAIDAIDDIGLPAVIKPAEPTDSNLSVKAWILQTPSQVEKLRREYGDLPEPFIVQRYVDGDRLNVQILAFEGEIVDRLVTMTTRSNRYDGTGNTVASVTIAPDRDLDRWSRDIVGRTGFGGFGCLQFYGRPGAGDLTFLELNPRLGGAFGIANTCGIDFPRLALETWLQGLRPDGQLSNYEVGKRMAWIGGDVFGLSGAIRSREIDPWEALAWGWEIVRSAVTADAFTTFTREDPFLLIRHQRQRQASRRPSKTAGSSNVS